MKSNLRNEIKSYIVRQGMTMQEVVDLLRDEHGWSDSVSNLSNKLQRESLRYTEAVQLADALGYEIVWQRRKSSHDRCREKIDSGAAPFGGSAGTESGQRAQSQNAQTHSGGCNSGKGAAGGADDGAACAGGVSFTEAGKRNLNFRWEVSGKPGAFLFFLPKGALTHHPEGAVVCLRHRALSEGDCGFCGSLQTMPQHLRALLSSSAQVSAVSVLETVCSLPAQTCHRQLCLRL